MSSEKPQAEKPIGKTEEQVECGLIMPISKTLGHSEQHWADVQTLLHRGITQAGFRPMNVWAGDLEDRVSERIVANIFRHEVVVADISDLNPNVMLELGLRLASKKPTIVVVESGGTIPFDIRDFHAIHYPGDLNILGMEAFFESFASTLKSKSDNYRKNTYKPFLGDVVVEVLEPSTKNVSIENVVVERLDEIGRRLSRIEQDSRPHPGSLEVMSRPLPRGPRRLYFRGSPPAVESFAEIVKLIGVKSDVSHQPNTSFIRIHTESNLDASRVLEFASRMEVQRESFEVARPFFAG